VDSTVQIASTPPPEAEVEKLKEYGKEGLIKVTPAPQVAQQGAEPKLAARDAAKESSASSYDRLGRVAPVEERQQRLNEEREVGATAAPEQVLKAEAPAAPPPSPAKAPAAAIGAQQGFADEAKRVAVATPEATLLKSESATVSPVLAPQASTLPVPGAGKGGAGGAKGNAAAGALVVNGTPTTSNLLRADAKAAAPFGFNYERTATSLRIVPAAAGYLLVTAAGQPLFPRNSVLAASNVIVPLPGETGDVTIVFAAAAEAPAIQPVRRAAASGTVNDATPSPASQLAIVVPPLP
jgi:hypothetical protein